MPDGTVTTDHPDQLGATTSTPVIDLSVGLALTEDGDALIRRMRDFLDRAVAERATHVIVVTSAMVYGAWENNPVPLDETRPVRPEPRFAIASSMAVAEVMVEQWRNAASNRTATILRPAPVVSEQGTEPLVRALAHAAGLSSRELPAPAQFLHRSDLDAAIGLCRRLQADGIFNVAPDGAINGERLRELVANPLRVSLPPRLREWIYAVRWFVARGPIPPGLVEYTRSPWVVSNEALRALGWEPMVTNEQAYVAGTDDNWYSSLSARRRQELALVGAVLGLATLVGAAVTWWRRRRRRADD